MHLLLSSFLAALLLPSPFAHGQSATAQAAETVAIQPSVTEGSKLTRRINRRSEWSFGQAEWKGSVDPSVKPERRVKSWGGSAEFLRCEDEITAVEGGVPSAFFRKWKSYKRSDNKDSLDELEAVKFSKRTLLFTRGEEGLDCVEKTGKPLKKGSPLPGAVGDFDLSLALSTPDLVVGKSWAADGRPLLEILAPGNADGARDERANLARCLSAKDAAAPELQLTLASVEEVKGERVASITFAMEGSLSGPWEDSNLAIGSGRPGQAITSRSRRFRNYDVTGTVGWSLTHGRVLTLEAKDSFSIGQLSATGSRAASSEAPLGTRADDSLKSLDARGTSTISVSNRWRD